MLPAPVANAIARTKAIFGAMSRPLRVLLFSTLLSAVAIGGFFAFQSTHEPYAVLFAQLEREDAGALVAKLKELKVPYRIQADGATIEVPEARVHELRLELASAGLPRGGGVGFESFDKMRLGATDFEQRVLYRRALEGELSRTIGTLGSVQSARVHLVLPEKSVFVARNEPASASLVVRLRPGRTLGPSEVAGIVHLTASSVAGLTADRVALVTTEGLMLHRPHTGTADGASGNADDGENGSQAHAMESALEDRARAMLEKVVGAGHVDVRVTAEIDMARVERVEDRFDPSHTALRSEESSIDRNGVAADATVAGVPGAESNLPTGTPAAAAAADAGAPKPAVAAATAKSDLPSRESHTRNYEIDHVTEKRTMSGGAVKRIAVAVIVDGAPKSGAPRSKDELDKLAALVRSAVGANDTRGDVVTVESIPFLDGDAAPVVAAPPVEAPPKPWMKYLPAAGAGAALLAIFVVGSLMARARRRAARNVEMPALAPSVSAAQLEAASADPADVRAAALERARRDPATAALVLRLWLGTTDTDANTAASH